MLRAPVALGVSSGTGTLSERPQLERATPHPTTPEPDSTGHAPTVSSSNATRRIMLPVWRRRERIVDLALANIRHASSVRFGHAGLGDAFQLTQTVAHTYKPHAPIFLCGAREQG